MYYLIAPSPEYIISKFEEREDTECLISVYFDKILSYIKSKI